MIGKLQYIVHRRPNIILVVGIATRVSPNPKENHMMEVKRIMRYLKGTKDYGLYYKRSDRFELNVFMDSNWAGNINDRKALVEVHSFSVMDKPEIELYFPIYS